MQLLDGGSSRHPLQLALMQATARRLHVPHVVHVVHTLRRGA